MMSSLHEKDTAILENLANWNKSAEGPVLKRKRFLARKIHKLIKMLKLGLKKNTKSMNEDDLECCKQNAENEARERKLMMSLGTRQFEEEEEQNAVNENWENWENWDSCYLCAASRLNCCYEDSLALPLSKQQYSSICYVFMPGEPEPIPVKLRTARIPGGVMWISYRPDVDICCRGNLYSFTSSQIPQGQRPTLV